MDAFKLLTRSTKVKTGQEGKKNSTPDQLPSAGGVKNPQLFPGSEDLEDAGKSQGQKRKRDSELKNGDVEDGINLDFFGSKQKNPARQVLQDEATGTDESKSTREKKEDKDNILSEADCKAILKSHKIKVADLRTPSLIVPDQPKKSSKKSKKQKTEPLPQPLSRKQLKKAQQLYPQPLTSFIQLRTRYQISPRLSDNIANQGYSVPTEVQLGTLPLLLGNCSNSSNQDGTIFSTQTQSELGPDLLVIAPTGSGKTLAFMIPLINRIIRHHHREPNFRGLLSIVLAPTKELVAQIVNEGRKLTAGTGVKVSAMRKGMRIVEKVDIDEAESDDQVDSSDSEEDTTGKTKSSNNAPITKSDILVSTPLMLVNALSANKSKNIAPLPSVQSLVLDEADVLLDPLFREQTLNIWKACTNSGLRVGLWSATMGSNIEDMTKSIIKERQSSLGLKDESFLIRLVVGLKDTAIPNISHKLVYAATEQGKLLGLRQVLRPTGASASSDTHLRPPFLVFTQSIPRAVALHSELKYDIPAEAGGSSRIAVLHSELSDSKRSDVMAGFRKGEIWVLITTDLLARGVDFRGINGVVNYDIPNSSAAYVHRVGRTGRAGREGGVAITFYTKEDIPYVKSIANVIATSERLRGVGEDKGIQKWLLDSLPDLSKKDRKELKKHGVKVRKPMPRNELDLKERRNTRITTRSGFERRLENNRKAAVESSKKQKGRVIEGQGDEKNGDWSGIED